MSVKKIISPSNYIQGEHTLIKLASYCESLGSNPIIISDEFVTSLTKEIVDESFSKSNNKFNRVLFNGECSTKEIERISSLAQEGNNDYIVGIGGGKTLDTAKAVGYYLNIPVVVAPTIASTDAPTSRLSVIYTEDGQFEKYLFIKNNPNLVLMDLNIIANAPARLLVAGMGDALSTYFEARATNASNSKTMAGENSTLAANALAKLCYDTLLSDGLKAKVAVESKSVTKAVENIVEANTLLSGIGFESGGLAGCHAIHNGLTALSECHHLYHGEKVAFGVLTQLVLENVSEKEYLEVLNFLRKVGLPTNLEQLGVKQINEEKLREVARLATVPDETIHSMPFDVCAEDVYAAILTVDKLSGLL